MARRRGRALRIAGSVLLTAGFLVAAYVAWLLWGTGVYTARVQDGLREEITLSREPRPAPEERLHLPGEPWAVLRIPKIDVDIVVIEGTEISDLKKGPGRYEDTAYPWEDRGRVGIAGHRTTYGAPFWALNELTGGDLIELDTEYGTYEYRVTRLQEVLPTAVGVLRQTEEPTLVLTTCAPRFSAAKRLIVFAERID